MTVNNNIAFQISTRCSFLIKLSTKMNDLVKKMGLASLDQIIKIYNKIGKINLKEKRKKFLLNICYTANFLQ